MAAGYAVVGRSEDDPVLYHADKARAEAKRLCSRRETATGRLCYIVGMAAWLADPRGAIRRAEAERFGGTPDIA